MRSKIRTTAYDIELALVQPVYKTSLLIAGEDTMEKKTLVKEMRVRKWFRKEAITSVEEYVTVKNTIAKSRSLVFDKYSSRFYATWHNADEIMNRLNESINKPSIGFNHGHHFQTRKT